MLGYVFLELFKEEGSVSRETLVEYWRFHPTRVFTTFVLVYLNTNKTLISKFTLIRVLFS